MKSEMAEEEGAAAIGSRIMILVSEGRTVVSLY